MPRPRSPIRFFHIHDGKHDPDTVWVRFRVGDKEFRRSTGVSDPRGAENPNAEVPEEARDKGMELVIETRASLKAPPLVGVKLPLDRLCANFIERLERTGWSQTEAAESLHVPLSTLNQKIKRLSIEIKRKSQ